MGSKAVLRNLYRANSRSYPRIYNAQQLALVFLRAKLGRIHEQSFGGLAALGLPDDAVCVDAGANCGQSVVSIKQILPGARIHAFEPNPSVQSHLQRTADRFEAVQVHRSGLGDRSGDLTLHVPVCGGVVFHQLASIDRPDLKELAAKLRGWGFTFASAGNVELKEQVIQLRRLDELQLRPDFVKIDVEGGELAVLRGAEHTIRSCLPVLMIEGGDRPELLDHLIPLGYRCCTYRNGELDFDTTGELNTFFVPGRKPDAD
jgi:FkbM family methyltransferase